MSPKAGAAAPVAPPRPSWSRMSRRKRTAPEWGAVTSRRCMAEWPLRVNRVKDPPGARQGPPDHRFSREMPMFDEAERGTRPRNVHEIGQDLSVLSVSDLDERIEALRREIAGSRRTAAASLPRRKRRGRHSSSEAVPVPERDVSGRGRSGSGRRGRIGEARRRSHSSARAAGARWHQVSICAVPAPPRPPSRSNGAFVPGCRADAGWPATKEVRVPPSPPVGEGNPASFLSRAALPLRWREVPDLESVGSSGSIPAVAPPSPCRPRRFPGERPTALTIFKRFGR